MTKSPQFVADLPPHTKLGCFDAKESTLRELHGFPCIPEAGVSKYVAQLNIKFPFVVWGGNCQVLSELGLNCTACTALHCSSTLQSGKIAPLHCKVAKSFGKNIFIPPQKKRP